MSIYKTNSGIEIEKIYDVITVCETILADYGNLPVYAQDDTMGVETDIPAGYITIFPADDKPLRIKIR